MMNISLIVKKYMYKFIILCILYILYIIYSWYNIQLILFNQPTINYHLIYKYLNVFNADVNYIYREKNPIFDKVTKTNLLLFACIKNDTDLMKYILSYNVNVNYVSEDKLYPLKVAIMNNNISMIKLLKRSNKINIKSKDYEDARKNKEFFNI